MKGRLDCNTLYTHMKFSNNKNNLILRTNQPTKQPKGSVHLVPIFYFLPVDRTSSGSGEKSVSLRSANDFFIWIS